MNVNTYDNNAKGTRGDKNSDLQLVKEGISIDGEKVSYDRVLGEYEDKAYETMDKTNIPKGMQHVVKEYFTELND